MHSEVWKIVIIRQLAISLMWKKIPYLITLYKIKYIFFGRKFKLKMLIYEALKKRLIFQFETNILGD